VSERAAKEAGGPTTWDVAFREGLARGLQDASDTCCREAWLRAVNTTQNGRGEWVPSIPLPFYGLRKQCECRRKFWTSAGYRGHYALEHALGLG
jgi:hypothetical protein